MHVDPKASLHFEPIFGSYLLIMVVGTLLLVSLCLVGTYRATSKLRQGTLWILRLSVILLVVLSLLRPAWVTLESQRQRGTVVLLVDSSRSMQITDMPGGQSRWDSLRTAVQQSLPDLEVLNEDLDIKFVTFDEQRRLLEWSGGDLPLPATAEGGQSDIAQAIVESLRRELGNRLVGMVLLTDGAQRVFEPSIELRQAVREMARLGYPLYTVPFGQPREKSRARDLAVESLQDHYTVFVKNDLQVHVAVRAKGFPHEDIPVEVSVTDDAGHSQDVTSLTLRANETDQLIGFRFPYRPEQPGHYRLTVSVPPQPGELVTKNNQLTAYVTVRDGGLKVLYLYGSLVGEQRRLRRAVNESPELQLEYSFIHHGRRSNWPISLDAFTRNQRPDVYLVESIHATAFRKTDLERLAEDVRRGSGLMMLGGVYSFGAGAYQRTPLADVLPIRMHRFHRQDLDAPIRTDMHLSGPLAMIPTTAQFVTRLAGTGDNLKTWESLSPLHGANRFTGLKANAMVLAKTSQGDPLLVAGQFGAGRVLAFAGDSTWTWWAHGAAAEHKRFWRQVVLWLAGRDEMDRDEVWIELPQRRYRPAASLTFTAGARMREAEVLQEITLEATLVQPDGTTQPLRLSHDGEQFTGRDILGTDPGVYAIQVNATQNGVEIGHAREEFVVFDHDLELHDPVANPQLLARLAKLTSDAGGHLLAPEQLPALCRDLKQQTPQVKIEVQTKWEFAGSPNSAWPFFGIVMGLLGTEWYLRKKWGFV